MITTPEAAEAYAATEMRLRMPTVSTRDAMMLTGRKSTSAFGRFCKEFGVTPCRRGRYRRQQLIRALEREAK